MRRLAIMLALLIAAQAHAGNTYDGERLPHGKSSLRAMSEDRAKEAQRAHCAAVRAAIEAGEIGDQPCTDARGRLYPGEEMPAGYFADKTGRLWRYDNPHATQLLFPDPVKHPEGGPVLVCTQDAECVRGVEVGQ